MSTLQTGAPHFKSLMKQYRHANYTLSKALNEFVDNAIKRANKIYVSTQVDDNQRLQELRVSDNIESGFDNMDQRGTTNPFNMGHIKMAHEDDSETSEFGVGMKAGALSAANQLNVYTRITRGEGTFKYVEVICDFIRMAETADVNESYNPFIREITYDEYKMNHPFEHGSTIKLSKIRDSIYPRTTQQNITTDICAELSATYTRFLSNGTSIEVNGTQVVPIYDFFEDPKCEPFTVTKEMFVLEKEGLSRKYLIRQTKELVTWQEFNRDSNEWSKLENYADGLDCIADLQKNGYYSVYAPFNREGVCLQLNTTFVFYSDMYHRQDGTDHPITDDALLIYKDDRCYGKKSIFVHRNGCNNYTLHEMDFVSKRLGKDIGITFNKEILMNGSNELIIAIKSALVDSKRGFTADTHSSTNARLFDKAVRLRLLDPETCSISKRPKVKDSSSNSDTESDHTSSKKSAKAKSKSKSKTKPKSNLKSSTVVTVPPQSSSSAVNVPEAEEESTKPNATIVNEWFSPEANESVQEKEEDLTQTTQHDASSNIPIFDHELEDRRVRTIALIMRLQQSVTEERVLSAGILSEIEKLIA